MKQRTPIVLFLFFVSLIMNPAALFAAGNQPEFTIAPPPLAYPTYTEPGSTQGKGTATYLSVSSGDFELTGFGGSATVRTVMEREDDRGQGFSFGGGFYLLSGESPSLTLSGFQLSMLANYEREITKNEGSNVIAFIGPNFSNSYISASGTSLEIDIYTTLIGFQAGAQYSVDADSMVFSPFIEYISQFGSAQTDTYISAGSFSSFTSTSTDLDITTTVFGFDILHKESGVTLSGILQQASGNSDSDVTIIQVSWAFGQGAPGSENGEKTASLRSTIEQRTTRDGYSHVGNPAYYN